MARASISLRESITADWAPSDLKNVRASFIGRADDDDVNNLYHDMLQEQRMPDAVATKLVETETVERKRAMVLMHKKMMSSDSANLYDWSQVDEMRLKLMVDAILDRQCPDLELVDAFTQRVCQGTKTWMATFMGTGGKGAVNGAGKASITAAGKGGLGIIVATMQCRHFSSPLNDRDAAVLFAMLECLQNIMQTKRGLRAVLKERGVMDAIAMCIDHRWTAMTELAIELCTYLAWVSQTGHALVLAAILGIAKRQREVPYGRIVETMDTNHLSLQSMALALINKLLTSERLDRDARSSLRYDIEGTSLVTIMQARLKEHQTIIAELDSGRKATQSAWQGQTSVRKTIMTKELVVALQTAGVDAFGSSAREAKSSTATNGSKRERTKNSNLVRYAADGHSVIDPHSGMMAGMCIAAKNKDATSLTVMGLVGRPSTKKRWFVLDGITLKWFYEDMATRASSEASVTAEEMLSVVAVLGQAGGSTSSSSGQFGIEIVAQSRRLQMWCDNEAEQIDWLVALRAARDSSVDSKYLDRLQVAQLSDEAKRECIDNFQKQCEFYNAISQQDRTELVKQALNGIDQTNAGSMSELVIKHAHISGRSRELLTLMRHLVLYPAEDEKCWPLLLRQAELVRESKVDEDVPTVAPERSKQEVQRIEEEIEERVKAAIDRERARAKSEEESGEDASSKTDGMMELEERILELEQENEGLKDALGRRRTSQAAEDVRESISDDIGFDFKGGDEFIASDTRKEAGGIVFNVSNPLSQHETLASNDSTAESEEQPEYEGGEEDYDDDDEELHPLFEKLLDAIDAANLERDEAHNMIDMATSEEGHINTKVVKELIEKLTGEKVEDEEVETLDVAEQLKEAEERIAAMEHEAERTKEQLQGAEKRAFTVKHEMEILTEQLKQARERAASAEKNAAEAAQARRGVDEKCRSLTEVVKKLTEQKASSNTRGDLKAKKAKSTVRFADAEFLCEEPVGPYEPSKPDEPAPRPRSGSAIKGSADDDRVTELEARCWALEKELERHRGGEESQPDNSDDSATVVKRRDTPLPPQATTGDIVAADKEEEEEADDAPGQSGPPPLKDDPKFAKFFKMLKMHLPKGAVAQKMTSMGLDPAILDMDPEQPLPSTSEPPAVKLKDDPKFAKFFKMLKMHLPKGAVAQKMTSMGLDPAILDMDPEQPLPSTSGPTTPGVETGQSQEGQDITIEVGEVFSKDVIENMDRKPNGKTKPFYWTKVGYEAVKGSIWEGLRHSPKVDFEVLESIVAAQDAPVAASDPDSAEGQPRQRQRRGTNVGGIIGLNRRGSVFKSEKVSLVTAQRSQNVGIVLGQFSKFSHEKLREFIVDIEGPLSKAEGTEKIMKVLPTDEEIDLMKGYSGDESSLADVDHFFFALKDVPRLRERVQCIRIIYQFEELAADLARKLELLEKAAREVAESKWLLKFLEVVLVIGNFVNAGTNRGRAGAFEIDNLLKLASIKGPADGVQSLLHFSVDCMEQNYPEFGLSTKGSKFNLNTEFENVTLAAEMSLASMKTEQSQLGTKFSLAQKELELQRSSPTADSTPAVKLIGKLEHFVEKGNATLSKLESNSEQCRSTLENAMKIYAQPVGTDPDDAIHVLLGTMVKFRDQYSLAAAQNEKARIRQKNIATAEKYLGTKKNSGSGAAAESPEKKDVKGVNPYQRYQSSMQASATDMIAEFQAKMGQRRKTIDRADEMNWDSDSDDSDDD